MKKRRLVVIGGGAAGFFCAVNAARMDPGLEVILYEKSSKLLSKVKVSGGGRCNVTHACFDIPEMSRRYPRGGNFVKKAFHRFFTTDTIQWFECRGVPLKSEADGRMFPASDSSQTIIDCLVREAEKNRVGIVMKTGIEKIRKVGEGFLLKDSKGIEIEADYVCLACGGFSKSQQFDWIRDLGHTIEEPVPSLFTFNLPGDPITQLMGISVEKAVVKIEGSKLEQEGPLLITHWGLSGPAVLKLSAWGARELAGRDWKFGIRVNWLPGHTDQSLRTEFQATRFEWASKEIASKNSFGLPARLWQYFVSQCVSDTKKRWADLGSKEQSKLINLLVAGTFSVKGKTTFKEEFVTAGGVVLAEVDPNTMMSKKVPGLYFAGEILDVDGITGGYNFQHAWTSGFIAGKSIVSS